MSVRNDITVDWTVSPRIVEIASPSTIVTVQDLYDTLRTIEALVPNLKYPALIYNVGSTGKQTLSASKSLGITLTLFNAKLKFEDRLSPTIVCSITDGNLVSVDENFNTIEEIEPSTFVTVKNEKDVSAGLISSDAANIVSTLNSTLYNGRRYDDILIDLLSMAAGRIREVSDGVFEFYERDNSTIRFTLTKAGNERNRS